MNDRTQNPDLISRACPVCGGVEASLFLSKGTLRLVQCHRCAMLFATPVDATLVSGVFYDRLATPFYLSPDKLESDYSPVRFERELRLFRRYCHSGQVLDVGCSTGAFLHQLTTLFRGDYTVVGTDVAGPALDYADSRGVPVLRTPFQEHDFGAERFDAITFWAVMEHLAEPKRFLSKAATLLKQGGYCFMLVPNMKSFAVHLLGARYRYFMPEHLNYFTTRTLRLFADLEARLGFVTLKSTHFNPLVIWQDWLRPAGRVEEGERAKLLKRTTVWKQKPVFKPIKLLYSGLEHVLGAFRLADNLILVLRRK
jgi:2-polyprenyl-3-methyl-5-hydroxy-6-metoxy-1,4-benzoquinol methylase